LQRRLSLLTFLSCSKKVSQTARMLFEKRNGFQCAQHMPLSVITPTFESKTISGRRAGRWSEACF
jgi:hypothetical protein